MKGLYSSDAWQPIVTRLADHFTMICPDNRGVGQSLAKRPLRNISHTSSDLIELLDYLDVDPDSVDGLIEADVTPSLTETATRTRARIVAALGAGER